MDAIDTVLSGLRLQSTVFTRMELGANWGFEKDALEGAPFHIILAGEAWVTLEGHEPTRYAPGDIAVLPRGSPHRLTATLDARTLPFADVYRRSGMPDWHPSNWVKPLVMRFGVDGHPPATRLLSGVFQFARRPSPLLQALPGLMRLSPARIDTPQGAFMVALISAMDAEIDTALPGAAISAGRLADYLFVQAVRAELSNSAGDPSWLRGLADARIGRALSVIHDQPEANWTVATLARQTGMSRSLFAQEFQRLVGRSPIDYLRDWRMYEASALLTESDLSCDAIAVRVGYGSGAALSKAFQRWAGQSPTAYRRDRVMPNGVSRASD